MSQAIRRRLTTRVQGTVAAASLAGALLAGAATHALADPVDPQGIWYTDGDESIIKVHSCTENTAAYCGTMVWLKEPTEADGSPKIDKLNKDPAKKNKPLIGIDILINMTSEDDHWSGKAYNPEDGKFYDVTFKVKSDKAENDQADLRGCLFKFLCKTETFTRAKEVPGGDPTATADASGSMKKHKPRKDAKKETAVH
jgi:uncharacterized protein (DUF2147 family)